MLGPFLNNPGKKFKMLKMLLLLLKHSIIKKLTEEMVNSQILIGLLISSWNKLLLLDQPSEKESMTMFMTIDLIVCFLGKEMKTLKKAFGVDDQGD